MLSNLLNDETRKVQSLEEKYLDECQKSRLLERHLKMLKDDPLMEGYGFDVPVTPDLLPHYKCRKETFFNLREEANNAQASIVDLEKELTANVLELKSIRRKLTASETQRTLYPPDLTSSEQTRADIELSEPSWHP
jgi:hypothetical protein